MRCLALAAVMSIVPSLASSLAMADAQTRKDRDVAQVLSGVGAGVSSALVVSSFLVSDPRDDVNRPMLFTGLASAMVTPSLGELYAGQYLTWGMGVRAVAVGFAIYTVESATETVTCDGATAGQTCQKLTSNGLALMGLAAIAYIGGVWYDVADAPDAVVRHNARLDAHLAIVPSVMPTSRGAIAPAVYFSATY